MRYNASLGEVELRITPACKLGYWKPPCEVLSLSVSTIKRSPQWKAFVHMEEFTKVADELKPFRVTRIIKVL